MWRESVTAAGGQLAAVNQGQVALFITLAGARVARWLGFA